MLLAMAIDVEINDLLAVIILHVHQQIRLCQLILLMSVSYVLSKLNDAFFLIFHNASVVPRSEKVRLDFYK